ncbi:MAG: type II secretion system protein [Planctomycetes bacterium]|nr:type II secretion system protein [Planctomycetota bacterium]
MPRPSRLAFTLLELLVVIAIMTILSAMILVGASALMGNAERKKTETIIQTVKTGIELAIANKGSAISPTEHPFAGSQADSGGARFEFVRGDSRWPGSVSTTGTALKGVPNPEYLSADQNRLMMLSDRYQDERIVLLHGARREDIGVLQSLRKVVTKYRLLPMPPKKANGTQPKVLSPRTSMPSTNYQGNDNTDFPDTLIPSKPQLEDGTYGRLSDTKPALDYLFGNSSAQSELASLKALYNADPTLPEDQNKFRTGVESRTVTSSTPPGAPSVTEPLVYSNAGTGGASDFKNQESKWKPGYIPVSTGGTNLTLDSATSSRWVRYRLAGLAVYDAWNNELMTVTGSNNSYRVISAGQDGALAVDPGKDNRIDGVSVTVDAAGKLQLDAQDKDGSKDNLQ